MEQDIFLDCFSTCPVHFNLSSISKPSTFLLYTRLITWSLILILLDHFEFVLSALLNRLTYTQFFFH